MLIFPITHTNNLHSIEKGRERETTKRMPGELKGLLFSVSLRTAEVNINQVLKHLVFRGPSI